MGSLLIGINHEWEMLGYETRSVMNPVGVIAESTRFWPGSTPASDYAHAALRNQGLMHASHAVYCRCQRVSSVRSGRHDHDEGRGGGMISGWPAVLASGPSSGTSTWQVLLPKYTARLARRSHRMLAHRGRRGPSGCVTDRVHAIPAKDDSKSPSIAKRYISRGMPELPSARIDAGACLSVIGRIDEAW